MKKILVVIVLLSLTCSWAWAGQESVIGKAHIKKGQEFGGSDEYHRPAIFVAFKDQSLYILMFMPGNSHKGHNGGYVLDAYGFSHDCPEHGEEIMSDGNIIGLPIEMVLSGAVKVEIFDQ